MLELHSHKATRKAVAEELGAALARNPNASSGISTGDRDCAGELRRQLTDHAIAVNEVRQPLGRSVHDIIGEIVSIDSSPAAELTTRDAFELSAGRLQEMIEQAERLSENWAPYERRSEFVWRDMAPDDASRTSVVRCRTLVEDHRLAAADLRNLCTEIHQDLHLVHDPAPGDIDRLSELVDLIERRPSVSPDWLTAGDPEAVGERVEHLAELMDAQHRVERRAIGGLQHRAVPAAVKWCRDQSAILGDIEAAVAGFVGMVGSAVTVSKALAVLGKRAEHERLETEIGESIGPLRGLLGELVTAPQVESLREASTWVRQVRSHIAAKNPGGGDGIALSPAIATAVFATALTPAHVTQVFGQAKHSREQLLGLFQADYSNSIRERLAESFDSETAEAVLHDEPAVGVTVPAF